MLVIHSHCVRRIGSPMMRMSRYAMGSSSHEDPSGTAARVRAMRPGR